MKENTVKIVSIYRQEGKKEKPLTTTYLVTVQLLSSFLLSFFLQKSAVNVKEVMDTWTIQMGLPVVTIKRIEDNKATADQKVFLILPGAKPNRSSPFK